jgi:hypothetical protein
MVLKDLDGIHDDSFVVYFCLEFLLPRESCILKLLEYAVKRARQAPKNKVQALTKQTQKTLARFYTFQLLNNRQQKEFDVSEWKTFKQVCFIQKISELFTMGQLDSGMLIWQRHCQGKSSFFSILKKIAIF